MILRSAVLLGCMLGLIVPGTLDAQPITAGDSVIFSLHSPGRSVYIGGDFNQWEWERSPLQRGSDSTWRISFHITPGVYQYKFVVMTDSARWQIDPANPETVENYNRSGRNSIFTLSENREIFLKGYDHTEKHIMTDEYPSTGRPLYLNIIWHQHQPLYLDPETDMLQGPWVRTHATKDYYDMTAALERFPNIHFTVNVTSSLLLQLQEYYVKRLRPFIDTKHNVVDAQRYFAEREGMTDPWIDLALKPTSSFTKKEKKILLENVWNAFGVSEVMIGRFPEYERLKRKAVDEGAQSLSIQEQREVKFWFYLAHFDPDFLRGRVRLATGSQIDLTDIVEERDDGKFRLKVKVTEHLCNRMVAEAYKVCAAIVPLHKQLLYHPVTHKGQVEVLTTPFYHPILPLLYDSDLARLCQPRDAMPSRFSYPQDAYAQVGKAVEYFKRTFGIYPSGMWPAEGSVAHDVLPAFSRHNISWVATDQKILGRSKPAGQEVYYPYVAETSRREDASVVVVFRESELSDKIGFVYQSYRGEDAADDFVRSILRYAPNGDGPDRLLTVILDGENAWEWYREDNDGKEFQNALYRKLSKLFESRQVITTTVTEYIQGNPNRNIPAHPVASLPKLEWLWPGSWINANYDTWIGEDEENRAWEYLLRARKDLGASGLMPPDPKSSSPRKGTKKWYSYRAWESMYAAEGSDWFWWYGTDQTAPAGDKPFDLAFITHLNNVYTFARKAGADMPERRFEPIITSATRTDRVSQGTMTQSSGDRVKVILYCDAKDMYVRTSLFVAGNHPSVGNWQPNRVKLYNDGTHGDVTPGDNVWSLELALPAGFEFQYKFTNSGPADSWTPGEEFPAVHRRVRIPTDSSKVVEIHDVFGEH